MFIESVGQFEIHSPFMGERERTLRSYRSFGPDFVTCSINIKVLRTNFPTGLSRPGPIDEPAVSRSDA
jgi:hypothetical protein